MKPLYIVGTDRNVGKTTTSVGLLHAIRERGYSIGYMKPLGQRLVSVSGHMLHEDAQLVASLIGVEGVEQIDMAVPVPRGVVERNIQEFNPAELLNRVAVSYEALVKRHDLVIVEGMGNVAMGACLGVSAAEACVRIGAKALLVSGGGIGRTIDEIALCATFLGARGVGLSGAIVNKVWPDKYDRVKDATTQGLANIGITSFGTLPFHDLLAAPTMRQVLACVGGTVIGGAGHMDHRVKHTIVAAMEAQHMLHYIKGSTLVIVPGDRTDNILASLRAHMLGGEESPAVSGLVLTGDFTPEASVMEKIGRFHLPVIVVKEDTLTTASKVTTKIFKIEPGDQQRLAWAVRLVKDYVDVDGVLNALKV